jgi:hypothetical protein
MATDVELETRSFQKHNRLVGMDLSLKRGDGIEYGRKDASSYNGEPYKPSFRGSRCLYSSDRVSQNIHLPLSSILAVNKDCWKLFRQKSRSAMDITPLVIGFGHLALVPLTI